MTIPHLPRGVRRKFDKVRARPVLLGPERAIMLDEIGEAILSRVDGVTTLEAIVADLAASYDAPVEMIHGDVVEFLQGLADKRLVDLETP